MVGLVVVAVFLAGIAVGGALFTHDSKLKQIADCNFPFKRPAANHAVTFGKLYSGHCLERCEPTISMSATGEAAPDDWRKALLQSAGAR